MLSLQGVEWLYLNQLWLVSRDSNTSRMPSFSAMFSWCQNDPIPLFDGMRVIVVWGRGRKMFKKREAKQTSNFTQKNFLT